jgi:hypothetical protein
LSTDQKNEEKGSRHATNVAAGGQINPPIVTEEVTLKLNRNFAQMS